MIYTIPIRIGRKEGSRSWLKDEQDIRWEEIKSNRWWQLKAEAKIQTRYSRD
jgi:hypothetical protein